MPRITTSSRYRTHSNSPLAGPESANLQADTSGSQDGGQAVAIKISSMDATLYAIQALYDSEARSTEADEGFLTNEIIDSATTIDETVVKVSSRTVARNLLILHTRGYIWKHPMDDGDKFYLSEEMKKLVFKSSIIKVLDEPEEPPLSTNLHRLFRRVVPPRCRCFPSYKELAQVFRHTIDSSNEFRGRMDSLWKRGSFDPWK